MHRDENDISASSGAANAPQAFSLRDMCRRHNIRFKKGLGQNLLLDDNINRIMVDAAALTSEDAVLEVGAGLGALTRRIVREAGQVLSVEIDATFLPCLEEQFGQMSHVHLFRGDILNHAIDQLAAQHIPGATSYKMLSNLPYYITTPIIFEFLESPLFFERMVVMLQEEVGQRLVAPVNSADYGVLTLAAQFYADIDIVHHVPASCFMPRPKVDSCIVRFRLIPGTRYPEVDRNKLMKVVRTAFSQRRKTLRNTLVKAGVMGLAPELAAEALEAVGIDSGRRPQTLSLNEFVTLTQALMDRSSDIQ